MSAKVMLSLNFILLNLFFLSNKTILRVDFLNAESQNRKRLSSFEGEALCPHVHICTHTRVCP